MFCLIGNSSRYRLSYPPCCICAELKTLTVRFLNGLNTQIALLNQIEQHPRPTYLFAILTTRRRFASAKTLLAKSSPFLHSSGKLILFSPSAREPYLFPSNTWTGPHVNPSEQTSMVSPLILSSGMISSFSASDILSTDIMLF